MASIFGSHSNIVLWAVIVIRWIWAPRTLWKVVKGLDFSIPAHGAGAHQHPVWPTSRRSQSSIWSSFTLLECIRKHHRGLTLQLQLPSLCAKVSAKLFYWRWLIVVQTKLNFSISGVRIKISYLKKSSSARTLKWKLQLPTKDCL